MLITRTELNKIKKKYYEDGKREAIKQIAKINRNYFEILHGKVIHDGEKCPFCFFWTKMVDESLLKNKKKLKKS